MAHWPRTHCPFVSLGVTVKYDRIERKYRASGESQSGLSLRILLGPSKAGMCPLPGVERTTSEMMFCDLLSHNCSQRIYLWPAGSKRVGSNIFSFVAFLWRNKVPRSMIYSGEDGFRFLQVVLQKEGEWEWETGWWEKTQETDTLLQEPSWALFTLESGFLNPVVRLDASLCEEIS